MGGRTGGPVYWRTGVLAVCSSTLQHNTARDGSAGGRGRGSGSGRERGSAGREDRHQDGSGSGSGSAGKRQKNGSGRGYPHPPHASRGVLWVRGSRSQDLG